MGRTPLANILERLLACSSSSDAVALIASKGCKREHRKALAELAGLDRAWVACDQSVAANVQDLADQVVLELYEPFWFFSSNLSHDLCAQARPGNHDPRSLFALKMATPPLLHSKQDGFWMARAGLEKHDWLPPLTDPHQSARSSFDAVVHVVQGAGGTGIHVGGGRVLTCAHVVDSRDDESLSEDELPSRVGRKKVVMFANKRTYICECTAVEETVDGCVDVAVLVLGDEVQVKSRSAPSPASCTSPGTLAPLAEARVADEPVAQGARLFCVGNPSNVDLESHNKGSSEFAPPIFHTSAGSCLGYSDARAQMCRDAQATRGRAPTRGELKSAAAAAVHANGGAGTSYLLHSCWTYWGHSGAPLFACDGRVVGLHCAWDDRSGVRWAQQLPHLHAALRAAHEAASNDVAGRGAKRRRG
jgi:hypothetical protein